MAHIILDFGSGNAHKNNWDYLKRMIDELKNIDTGKHTVTIKHQLFKQAGDNIPLDREIFRQAYEYAAGLGYKMTSSVFDKESLDFLLGFDVPFVKIANRRELDWLIGEVPRRVPIVVSIGDDVSCRTANTGEFQYFDRPLYCISNYPAKFDDYIKTFSGHQLHRGISDHTICFSLFRKFEPELIEWHYVLEHDANNLDGGIFARTPNQLAEIL